MQVKSFTTIIFIIDNARTIIKMMREETKINKDMPMGAKFHLLRSNLMESRKKSNMVS